MWTISNKIRYEIIAHQKNKLIVNILGKGLYFMRSAHQIFNNPEILNGFSQEEAAFIGYIVGIENKISC
ncbi:MAG: hypothetical protein V4471_04240 [Pseudomonadota bacterium]